MSHAVCVVPVSPMRKEASHRSEMTSQLLFGEFVEILSEAKDFFQVKCLYDGYEGWCQSTQLEQISDGEIIETKQFASAFQNKILINNQSAYIPFGSPLYYLEMESFAWEKFNVNYLNSKQSSSGNIAFSYDHLKEISFQFLNTAYLWGGKSVYGIDCSGFAQQVFKFFGIKLLRDAYLQATQGETVNHVTDAIPGDLAFFKNEENKITHVGIVLDKGEIIHASGKVRIDKLDAEGIVTNEGNRTHHLHSIKRMANLIGN